MKRFVCHSEAKPKNLWTCSRIISDKLRDPSLVAQHDRRENGFTLAEILVVMAIIAIVGTILVLIFTNTLRGSNKSQMLAVIKQNGQAVLENMDKEIRSAENVLCPSGQVLVIRNDDGTYTRYKFFEPTVGSSLENGKIMRDNPQKWFVGGIQQSDADFINENCGQSDPMDEETGVVVLTDTSTTTGVSVQDGSFTRDTSAGSKDQVTVKFDLTSGVAVSSQVSGQIDPVTFQTTIKLR